MPFTKRDIVFYRPNQGRSAAVVRARVDSARRDGTTCTITALFTVDDDGRDQPGSYLGYRYTIGQDQLYGDCQAARAAS